jgi:hypothetical protein
VVLPFNLEDNKKGKFVVQPDISVISDMLKIEDAGCVGGFYQ